jgi:3',5'-cyclic AMP phosphodiesterase CpdA
MSVLFHVSDLHFGREDRAALDWFAAAVAGERPDAVLVTGDLTTQARSAEYAAAVAWLTALEVPMTIEVGNHDLPYFNPWSRFVRPYVRYQRVERALEKPMALPDAEIVPLQTTARFQFRLNWAHGRVSKGRLAKTVETLKATPPGRVRIVTCHHPLADKPGGHTEGRTHGGREALFALAEAGTDLVLSGHVHDPFDIVWNEGARPVRMIGAGTLSERVRTSAPSYNRIEIANGAVQVAHRTLG